MMDKKSKSVKFAFDETGPALVNMLPEVRELRPPITLAAPPAARHTGTVKFFDRLKGFGFIIPDSPGDDVFVHYTAIDGEGYRNLWEGDRVEFDLVQNGEKGLMARNVRKM
jgi:CspA family cold shock protein